MNCIIVLLDSSLRFEIIYNEVNKLLGPKNGRIPKNADCKDVHKCRGCLVLGFELPGSQDKKQQALALSFKLGDRYSPRSPF